MEGNERLRERIKTGEIKERAGKPVPRLIKAELEGPSMGFTVGCAECEMLWQSL